MSAAAVEPAPALPDYLTDPSAVLKDDAQWRYGRAPDYSNTRKVWQETKTTNHETPSLPSLVENLVKNWEIEASFKTNLADWRTVDHPNYTFAINGGPPQSAEYMLEVGTYNAIIAEPNEFYSPRTSDFASSHKTFKRMMPTFAWEVLEVYSGPPQVAFRWRHWGEMKKDYVGFNDKGEKITAPAHGGMIDIEGVTVATVNEKVQLQRVETWFDPLEMFRQIAPKGIVNKEVVPPVSSATPTTSKQEPDSGIDTAHEPSTKTTQEGTAPTKSIPNPTITLPQQPASNEPPASSQQIDDSPVETSQQTPLPKNTERHDEIRLLIRQVLAEDFPSLHQHSPSKDAAQAHPQPTVSSSATPPQPDGAMQAQDHSHGPRSTGACPFLAGALPSTNAAPRDATLNQGHDQSHTQAEDLPLGAAVASAPESAETKQARSEMGRIAGEEGEGYMNQE